MTSPLDLITTTEACEILGGIHRKTLIRWGQAGILTAVAKLPGETSTWLWSRADVEQLAAQKATAATA